MKKIMMCLFLFMAVSPGQVTAQDHYFKILSFSIEEKEVQDYSITFEFEGKKIIPKREGNKIYVPNEVRTADKAKINFRYAEHNFSYDVSKSLGYVDTDELKVNFKVKIDVLPFSEDYELTEEYKSHFCVLYLLRTEPEVKLGSNLLANSLTTVIGDVCTSSHKKRDCP